MKTFDLELRITLFGSIITWKVLLEDSTNDNQIVLGWIPSPEGFLFKKLPGFQVKNNSLEVFASCHGIKGGTLTCEVIINDVSKPNKVLARVEDKVFAKESYQTQNF
jgi:hypothetical protein